MPALRGIAVRDGPAEVESGEVAADDVDAVERVGVGLCAVDADEEWWGVDMVDLTPTEADWRDGVPLPDSVAVHAPAITSAATQPARPEIRRITSS